jgi:hypothetical protein
MRSRLAAGVIAGMIAGIPMGIAMQMMLVPTPQGGPMPMMAMVAKVLRSDSLTVGWVYHLFNSAVIGAFFGGWFGRRVGGLGSGLLWGTLHGLIWWVLGGLTFMPLLLGMNAFSPILEPMRRAAGMGSLAVHLLYGLILGGIYAWLVRRSLHLPIGVRRTNEVNP